MKQHWDKDEMESFDERCGSGIAFSVSLVSATLILFGAFALSSLF